MLQVGGLVRAVSMFSCQRKFVDPSYVNMQFARSSETDEDKEITSYLGDSSQAIQVHGATQ